MSSYLFVGQSFAGPTTGTTGTFSGNVTSGGQFLAANGTAAAPGVAFTNALGTGLYRPSANALGLATNGTLALTLSSAQLGTAAGAWQFPAGTALLPAVSLNGVVDGLYQVSSGVIGLTGAAVEVARFSATVAQIPAAAYFVLNGRAKIGSLADNQIQILPNAGGGSTAQLLFNTTDGNGSKIRNNGGGIINFEDGNASGIAAQIRAGMYLNNNGTYGLFFNTSAAYNNGGNAATAFLGLATASLTAMAINATQDVLFYGSGGLTGTNTGTTLRVKTIAAQTTLSLASATTVLLTIPAGALVLMATARVTTAITSGTSTTWSFGTGAISNDFGSGLAFTANTTVDGTNYVGFTGSQMFPSATALNCVLNVGAATAGVIRTVVYYIDVTAPTS